MLKAINPNILVCAVALVVAAFFLRPRSELTTSTPNPVQAQTTKDTADPSKTKQYWNQVLQLRERGKAEGQREPSEAVWNQKRFQEYANGTAERFKAFSDIIAALEALPPSSVDPEAVEFALLLADTYRKRVPIYQHAIEINSSLSAYDDRYNSSGAFWEALIRGALGDPTGLANEQRSDLRGIQAEITKLQAAWRDNTVRMQTVESRQTAVRVHLVQKYPKHFQ
jgi:hypothetical protein